MPREVKNKAGSWEGGGVQDNYSSPTETQSWQACPSAERGLNGALAAAFAVPFLSAAALTGKSCDEFGRGRKTIASSFQEAFITASFYREGVKHLFQVRLDLQCTAVFCHPFLGSVS